MIFFFFVDIEKSIVAQNSCVQFIPRDFVIICKCIVLDLSNFELLLYVISDMTELLKPEGPSLK